MKMNAMSTSDLIDEEHCNNPSFVGRVFSCFPELNIFKIDPIYSEFSIFRIDSIYQRCRKKVKTNFSLRVET